MTEASKELVAKAEKLLTEKINEFIRNHQGEVNDL